MPLMSLLLRRRSRLASASSKSDRSMSARAVLTSFKATQERCEGPAEAGYADQGCGGGRQGGQEAPPRQEDQPSQAEDGRGA